MLPLLHPMALLQTTHIHKKAFNRIISTTWYIPPPPSPSLFHSSLLLLLLLSQQQKLILPSFLITTIYICIISRRPSSPHYLIPMQPYSNKTLQISFFLYHAGMRRIAISFVLYPWFVKAPFCLKILLEIKKDHGCTRAL